MPQIDEAIEALLAYQQADMEGVMVLTSRQAIHEVADEIKKLRDFARWVDSWVSNPVGSYSVNALDGLFGMTRDKLGALSLPLHKQASP